MKNSYQYKKFKERVKINANYECEIEGCNECGDLTVHHLLPCSTYPEYKYDPDNGLYLCGPCHSKLEALIRKRNLDWYNYIPDYRLNWIIAIKEHEKWK